MRELREYQWVLVRQFLASLTDREWQAVAAVATAFGSVATFFAILLALFAEPLRVWWHKPAVSVRFDAKTLTYGLQVLRVENKGRGPMQDVSISVLQGSEHYGDFLPPLGISGLVVPVIGPGGQALFQVIDVRYQDQIFRHTWLGTKTGPGIPAPSFGQDDLNFEILVQCRELSSRWCINIPLSSFTSHGSAELLCDQIDPWQEHIKSQKGKLTSIIVASVAAMRKPIRSQLARLRQVGKSKFSRKP